MTVHYSPRYGLRVTFHSPDFGFSWQVPDDWTVARSERHLKELVEFYEVGSG